MPTGQKDIPLEDQLKSITATLNEVWARYDKACASFDARGQQLLKAEARAEKAEFTLGRIFEWTAQYGEQLIPHAPYHDSYGDGMQAAKEQIKRILGA